MYLRGMGTTVIGPDGLPIDVPSNVEATQFYSVEPGSSYVNGPDGSVVPGDTVYQALINAASAAAKPSAAPTPINPLYIAAILGGLLLIMVAAGGRR